MTPPDLPAARALSGRIGRVQLFALGFGSIIGSAWVVILGEWLRLGGPGGAVLGFLAGGLVFVAIGACFAELTTRVPRAGGEFVFALRVFGLRAAFFVGWFVALTWIAVTVFEGLVVSVFLEMLLPAIRNRTLYEAFGAAVTRNQIVTGFGFALVIGAVNYRGGTAAARLQGYLTYSFLLVVLAVLGLMASQAHARNLEPFFPHEPAVRWWAGAAFVFANCAFLLNGFQAVCQAVEERASGVPVASLARTMMLSIVAAALFYCAIVLATSSVTPWRQLAGADLATVKAAAALPKGGIVAMVILAAATTSLLKTWNVSYMVAARVLLAMAREGLLPRWCAHVDERSGSPTHAVLLVGLLNVGGLFLGRGAIIPLVDMCSISTVIVLFLCTLAVPILRRRTKDPAEQGVPGGAFMIAIAVSGAAVMAASALLAPFFRTRGFPLEYALLLGWLATGITIATWFKLASRRGFPPAAIAPRSE